MIAITEKQNCCGCTACAAVCPKSCISMEEDSEGFLYPVADEKKCIHCGACNQVCPIENPTDEVKGTQKAYLVQHTDNQIRLESSAGGAFTAVASVVLKKGGVVFGAAYHDLFQVEHTFVESEEELIRFRNSKYVQSSMGDCFGKAKAFLQQGRWVCFSGTPCQIEGLAKYLGRNYENLLLVDVVCHGVPSPLIWNKYLQCQRVNEQKPDNIRFRDKYYGYQYSTMSFIQNGENIYHAGPQMDPMLRAFFSDICDRPVCYKCPFKKRYRVSDMTIWDCFSVYDFDQSMDDDKGTTRVLCHTKKGVEILDEAASFINRREVSAERLVKGVKEMVQSVDKNPRREQFFIDAQELSGAALFEKYYPITAKIKAKTAIRKMLIVTGTYGAVKKCLNKVRGR